MSEEQQNTLCQEVEQALLTEEPLDERMQKHIESCPTCRTLQKQLAIMQEDLKSLDVDTLYAKDGVRLADAVMQEVHKQAIFQTGTGKKQKKMFTHMGLVAACLVLVVMAVPFITAQYGMTSEDKVFEQESAPENSGTADFSDQALDFKPQAESAQEPEIAPDFGEEEQALDYVDGMMMESAPSEEAPAKDKNTPVLMLPPTPEPEKAAGAADRLPMLQSNSTERNTGFVLEEADIPFVDEELVKQAMEAAEAYVLDGEQYVFVSDLYEKSETNATVCFEYHGEQTHRITVSLVLENGVWTVQKAPDVEVF